MKGESFNFSQVKTVETFSILYFKSTERKGKGIHFWTVSKFSIPRSIFFSSNPLPWKVSCLVIND